MQIYIESLNIIILKYDVEIKILKKIKGIVISEMRLENIQAESNL